MCIEKRRKYEARLLWKASLRGSCCSGVSEGVWPKLRFGLLCAKARSLTEGDWGQH